MRFSLAFLPDKEEVDCSQYVWSAKSPGELKALRYQRDFLETPQHLESVLNHIVSNSHLYRTRLAKQVSIF